MKMNGNEELESRLFGVSWDRIWNEVNRVWSFIPVSTVDPADVSNRIHEAQNEFRAHFVRRWRTVITGDPEKRIRDNLADSGVRQKVQRVDEMGFMLGVMVTYLFQYCIVANSKWFPALYYLFLFGILFYRYFAYRAQKYHFFMIDFCYFVQTSLWLQTLGCGWNRDGLCTAWFQANYALTHGPLAIAVIAWQNSLVFHSIDKITSLSIHILPPIYYFLLLWDPYLKGDGYAETVTFTGWFLLPILIYMVHQALYLYIQFNYLAKDKSLVTSLRYLVTDFKNPTTQLAYKILIRAGIQKENEPLDPHCLRTTMIYVLFQFLFTVICLLPVPLLYHSYAANVAYLTLLMVAAVWKGGTYYIEVFSQRYINKFQQKNGGDHDE